MSNGWTERADGLLLDALNAALAGATDRAAEITRDVRADVRLLAYDASEAGRVHEVRELNDLLSRLDLALSWLEARRNARRAAAEIAHARADVETWDRRWN